MINGVFPQKALCDIGMPLEGLSQSALAGGNGEGAGRPPRGMPRLVPRRAGCRSCLAADPATALVAAQVLEQCAMLIALARFAQRFGLSAIGVQYQQGLAGSCAASDFAEGALGSAERFPIPDETGAIIRPGKPIPCINEVDMGSAIPQTMLWRLLDALGLPSATTLHDVRWGSEFEGTLLLGPGDLRVGTVRAPSWRHRWRRWLSAAGDVLPERWRDDHRPMQGGPFHLGARKLRGDRCAMHIGTGHAVELPPDRIRASPPRHYV